MSIQLPIGRSRRARRGVAALAAALAVWGGVAAEVKRADSPADAASAVTPLLYLDATNASSYGGTGTTWTDLSGNNRNGTISGSGIVFNATDKAIEFPGGSNGTAYVDLAGDFADFTGGMTIEFEGEFGATRANWERIFDFALGVNSTADSVWVGQFNGTNELALEVWNGGVSVGYCATSTSGTALGALNDRSFAKWVVTVGDVSGTVKCRIYKDGVELATQLHNPDTSPSGSASPSGGVTYALPGNTTRTSAFLGRSNFVADDDLEGSIRYIRIYDQALTPTEVGQNATSTVTFDANGGTGSMSPQTSTTAVALTTNTFTRTGRNFAGWNTAANGSGTAYANAATFPFSSDATLYAQWNATVTFDANGGTGTMTAQTSLTSAALTTNAFTRTGLTFAGWNTAANGSGTVYNDGATFAFTANTTLYAQWLATVTFDANGGTGSMADQTSTAPGTLSANTFTRTGRNFAGWNTAANGSGTAYADAATFPFSADTTLYAQWDATVTFDANGGTGSMTAQTSLTSAALTANTFTRGGHNFTGWNTAANGSGTAYADGATFAFTANTTVYAQWSVILVPRTVTFAANGGTGTMAAQTSSVSAVLTANTFARDGFVYDGWNTAADGSGTAYADGATYAFTADATLYAQWIAVPPAASVGFVPVPTGRLYDSRTSSPIVGGGQVREIDVAGLLGVPADASAVVLNVTAVNAKADGYVTVYPCGQDRPATSTVNVTGGRTVANSATVTLVNGKVCVYSMVTTDVVLDVNGAYSPSVGVSLLDTFSPYRLLDTRRAGTKLTPFTPVEVTVTDAPDVSSDAGAVVLNVTVTEPAAAGYVTAYACGTTMPLASNLNFVAGQTVPNQVTVEVGPGAQVCVASSVPTHLVVDVGAALTPTGAAEFSPLTPDRLIDTRTNGRRLAAGTPFELTVAGVAGVDPDAVAVTLNVTVTGPAGAGYLTSYPCGTPVPLASNLNFVAGRTVANAVTATLVGGKACFVSSAATDLVVDVSGQYLTVPA